MLSLILHVMTDEEFDRRWRAAATFRRVSHALPPLVRRVYDEAARQPADLAALKAALIELLELLASESGRTDANCTATDYFFSQAEPSWGHLPAEYRALLESLGGVLHDSVHAPKIAANFECLPEQLLERARAL
jgi:hypothetical protein